MATERSIFGVDPLDEFSLIVGNWILEKGLHEENLEIEAKVGLILDRETGQRVQLPVRNECIVDLHNIRFESKMTMRQHAHYNQVLNNLVGHTGAPNYTAARVRCERVKEIDYSYQGGELGRLRVTRDAETLKIKPNRSITKNRIADLNVYCPLREFDYRISLSQEKPIGRDLTDADLQDDPVSIREKNRLSYSHQNFVIDLTQVILPEKPQQPLHELEVEVKDAPSLVKMANPARIHPSSNNPNAAALQEWTAFDDQVLIFLNNIRLLIR
ncbi:mRNA triphosphatase CET1 [Violaceomyces palustris]|uniref:mRNA triphosphatase CET1 n=1 Tax=Violaceomyces palustris TaxID=1673888 RepID=A0ACD0NUS3_9BASI|nr:mRNA triphosphatase CET1 [Violaceomyces palustris]